MPLCDNCGDKISHFQYKNHNKLCPNCIRLIQLARIYDKKDIIDQTDTKLQKDFKNKIIVYTLKLQNEKWWIGKTKRFESKIASIKEGKVNKWLNLNPVVSIEEVIEKGNLAEKTLEYMEKYGWQNVRSTCYSEGIPEKYIPNKIKKYIEEQKGFIEKDNIKLKSKIIETNNKNIINPEQIFQKPNEQNEIIYTLKLQRNKWFIGKTNNLSEELEKIKSGNGSSWIKLYNFISLEESIKNGDFRAITIEYMKKYGWQNIRGFSFRAENWPPEEVKNQFKDYTEFEKEFETVYILKLENNKWFVGKTKNLNRSLDIHKKGSPPWVDLYKPIKVEKLLKNSDVKEITLEYMRKYGWKNVRGGSWKKWDLANPPRELRDEELEKTNIL